MITCLYNKFWFGFHKALIWLSDILSISRWKGFIIRLTSNSLKNPTYIVLSYISTRPWNWEIAIMVKVLVFGWHRSPLRSGFVSQSVSQSVSQAVSQSVSHCVLNFSPCSHWRIFMTLTQYMFLGNILPHVKGQGHRSKGQRSRVQTIGQILTFSALKKLRSHPLSFRAETFFMGPLSRYKKNAGKK